MCKLINIVVFAAVVNFTDFSLGKKYHKKQKTEILIHGTSVANCYLFTSVTSLLSNLCYLFEIMDSARYISSYN